MAHILISQLSCGDSNIRIKARVSRLWDFHDLNDDRKIVHIDLVLLDETVTIYLLQFYTRIFFIVLIILLTIFSIFKKYRGTAYMLKCISM